MRKRYNVKRQLTRLADSMRENSGSAMTSFSLVFAGTPHKHVETSMEGSRAFLRNPYVPDHTGDERVGQESNASVVGSVLRAAPLEPLKVNYSQAKKRCADCNRGTSLLWSNGPVNMKFRLCQACGKKRGGTYLSAIITFLARDKHRDLDVPSIETLREPGFE